MPAKILIVEDEAIVALDLQRRLIGMGYDVPHIAATHDRALSAATELKPDVVLMDIHISGKKTALKQPKKCWRR